MRAAFAVLMTLGLASTAEAKCGLPKLELLWSYPTAGATDVPINAELWVMAPWAWTNPTLRLDGREITYTVSPDAKGLVHALPGALEADHDYVLQVDYSSVQPSADAGVPRVFELRFRTGSSTATAPAAPKLGAHAMTDPLFQDFRERVPCPDVLLGQECLDTGPNTLHTWEARDEGALAWLVGDHVIPADCGSPQALQGRFNASLGLCRTVRTIGAGGLLGEATEVCVEAERPPPLVTTRDAAVAITTTRDAGIVASGGEGGCHVAHGSGGAMWMLALLGWRRRARCRA